MLFTLIAVSVTALALIAQFDKRASPGTVNNTSSTSFHLISDLEAYEDEAYGFSVAVPSGWRPIGQQDSQLPLAEGVLVAGYAVGWETARQSDTDNFADYILIELLPGDESGVFAADESARREFSINDHSFYYDELYVDHRASPNVHIDLVIYQREVKALGYTLSFYAIGEPSNRQQLFEAFQIMLRTYQQQRQPFSIS